MIVMTYKHINVTILAIFMEDSNQQSGILLSESSSESWKCQLTSSGGSGKVSLK